MLTNSWMAPKKMQLMKTYLRPLTSLMADFFLSLNSNIWYSATLIVKMSDLNVANANSKKELHCKSGGSKIQTYFTKIAFYTVEYDICICYHTI